MNQQKKDVKNTQDTNRKMQLIKELVSKNVANPTICCHPT